MNVWVDRQTHRGLAGVAARRSQLSLGSDFGNVSRHVSVEATRVMPLRGAWTWLWPRSKGGGVFQPKLSVASTPYSGPPTKVRGRELQRRQARTSKRRAPTASTTRLTNAPKAPPPLPSWPPSRGARRPTAAPWAPPAGCLCPATSASPRPMAPPRATAAAAARSSSAPARSPLNPRGAASTRHPRSPPVRRMQPGRSELSTRRLPPRWLAVAAAGARRATRRRTRRPRPRRSSPRPLPRAAKPRRRRTPWALGNQGAGGRHSHTGRPPSEQFQRRKRSQLAHCKERPEEALPLHQAPDAGAGEGVSVQHVPYSRAAPRDQPQRPPHGQTS
uniref:Homeobox A10 n=2 Tax=Sus scrofa TaxID=9823 RepID=A0A8D1HHT9_PIG